ncbi:uncharacterized protein LOC143294731 [Babylonia areolata]|uniref:uncharacterized protein LOC143294731 n=1 Tax=Babylonia areolata TaxID=304850 RepID=UPI003FD23464
MITFLVITSLVGLYLETALHLCVLSLSPSTTTTTTTTTSSSSSSSQDHRDLWTSQLVIPTAVLLVTSTIITNLSSLLLALRKDPSLGEARGRRGKCTCVVLHLVQLGLLWRAHRVLLRRSRRDWLRLTSLRLLHVGLTSLPYVILQARALILLLLPLPLGGQGVEPLLVPVYVLSLVTSLASSAVALCGYTLRHRLRGELVGVVVAVADRRPPSHPHHQRRSHVGLAVLLLGTVLELATRLAAFTLLSVEHASWALLPLLAHLSVMAAVHLCRARQQRSSDTGASVPTQLSRDNEVGHRADNSNHHHNHHNHNHHHLPRPSDSSTITTTITTITTPKPSPSSSSPSCSRRRLWRHVLAAMAKAYLNTFDLVAEDKEDEEEDEEEEGLREVGGRVRCRYVLFYSLVLVENLAMTAAWLLHSPLDYTVKLSVVVAVLGAFLLALGLKVTGCGCVLEGPARAGRSSSVSMSVSLRVDRQGRPGSMDSPRSFTALQALTAEVMADPRAGRQDFRSSTWRERASTGISLASVSSLANSDGRRPGKDPRGGHWHRRRRSLPEVSRVLELPDSVFLEALSRQQQQGLPEMSGESHHGIRHPADRQGAHRVPRDAGLVTEHHQRHLRDLIQTHHHHDNSPEIVWMTSLGAVAEQPTDGCTFDDPVLASRLVLESLGHPHHHHQGPDEHSHHSSSSKSRRTRGSQHGSNDLRFRRHDNNNVTSKRQLLLANRTGPRDQEHPQDLKPPRAWRGNRVACDSYELHRDGVQYRYMTRCSCGGSPSSTPRRRPGHQLHTRKTHSYGSHHHPHHSQHHHHHHTHHRPKAAYHTTCSVHRSDSSSLRRSTSREEADSPRGVVRSREGSTWVQYVSSRNPPRPPPPSSHTRQDSDTSLSSTSPDQEEFPRHRSRRRRRRRHRHHHHHGEGSQRAATWPRRKPRQRGRSRGRADSPGPPLLPREELCTRKVVQSWLRGLEVAGHPPPPHPNNPPHPPSCNVHSDDDEEEEEEGEEEGEGRQLSPRRSAARAHRLQYSDRSFSDTLDDDYDDDEEEDEDSEDSIFLNAREKSKHFRGRWTRTARHRPRSKSPLSDAWSMDDSYSLCSGQAGQGSRKDSRFAENRRGVDPSVTSLTFVERAPLSGSSKRDSRSALPSPLSDPPQDSHPRHRNATRINTTCAGSKTKGHHQQTMSRSHAPSHASQNPAPDSGVSLSTAQDSDGSRSRSRSNTQGRSKVSVRGYLSLSKTPGSDPGARPQEADLPKGNDPTRRIHPSDVQQKTVGDRATSETLGYLELDEGRQNPMEVTLEVDESLV